jgi:hypothetical protein
MKRPECSTCPYWAWQLETDNEEGPKEKQNIDYASCKRNAPSTYMMRHNPQYLEIVNDSSPVWPRTVSWDYCGEHPDFPAYVESITRKST